jgi:Na+:H+ antiporter, NhaA family
MSLFALANAGLEPSLNYIESSVTLAVFFGFAIGKQAGILLFTWLAIQDGYCSAPSGAWLESDSRRRSARAGIGFTMALFIANLAFTESLMNSMFFSVS